MSGSMHSPRIVDGLLLLDDVDGDFDDLEVVEDLLRSLGDDLGTLADAPSAAFLDELLAAVPASRRPAGRGIRIAVTSGAILLAAAGSAAAATGSLPDSVQSAVHAAAESVGIGVPDADSHGPPATGGSQDGTGHGRSDEAPGRPEQPGQPVDPGRADEAPAQPEDPGSIGVDPEGVPSGQADNEHADPTGIENPNAGAPDPNSASDPTTHPAPTVPPPGTGSPNANGGGADDEGDADGGSGGSGADDEGGNGNVFSHVTARDAD